MNAPAQPSIRLFTRLATLGQVDVEQRTCEVVWSTGAPVPRFDWDRGQRYMEALSLEPGAVRLGRLNGGAPVLNTHAQYSLNDVLGVVEPGTAKVDGKRGTATLRFSSRDDVEPIFRDIKDQIIVNVSIGYARYEMEATEEVIDGLPVYRVVDYEPFEISLVPVGADAGASVRREGQFFIHEGEVTMKTEVVPNDDAAAFVVQEFGPAGRQLRDHLISEGRFDRAEIDQMFRGADSLRAVRTRVLQRLAEISETAPIRSSWGGADDAEVEIRTRIADMSEMLCARFGGPAPADRARQYAGLRISEMVRQLLELRGVRTTGLTPAAIFTRAGQMTTSDLPELLLGTGNRFLRTAYDSYQGGLIRACKASTAPDFRAKQKLMLGEAPTLLKVLEGGEFKYGALAESKESYSLATYGRIVPLSRHALVNDDLNAFADLMRMFGRAAAEFVASQLVTLLTSNPVMNDAVQLFHATHANVGTTGAISVDSLGEAKKLMRLQKGLDGVTAINATPRYLIVPATKETIAEKYLAELSPATAENVNPFAKKLELLVEPRLDAVSTTAWYMAADPEQIDTIEYAYLEEQPGPRIEVAPGFHIDGMQMKCAIDFGAGVLDHRGLVKNVGA